MKKNIKLISERGKNEERKEENVRRKRVKEIEIYRDRVETNQ